MDRGFKFRLEKVLELKIQAENNYMIIHSKILNELTTLKNEIKKLELQYEMYSKMQQEDSDILSRQIAHNYMNSLFQSIQNYNEILKDVEQRYKESTKKLISLQSERKSIEKLKEKQYQKFLKELEEEEAIQNDEFAIQSYFRNSND